METTKKITLSTIKSFIKKNRGNIFINVKSSFDGMVDCVTSCDGGFMKATTPEYGYNENNYGIGGAWFVRDSRDWFQAYEDERFTGYKVSNCCGSFIIAIEKPIQTATPKQIKNTFQNNKVVAFWNGLQFVSL